MGDKMDFKGLNIKKMVDKLTNKAKKKNLIKPISEAFKDVPTKKEIHKGEIKNYLN